MEFVEKESSDGEWKVGDVFKAWNGSDSCDPLIAMIIDTKNSIGRFEGYRYSSIILHDNSDSAKCGVTTNDGINKSSGAFNNPNAVAARYSENWNHVKKINVKLVEK